MPARRIWPRKIAWTVLGSTTHPGCVDFFFAAWAKLRSFAKLPSAGGMRREDAPGACAGSMRSLPIGAAPGSELNLTSPRRSVVSTREATPSFLATAGGQGKTTNKNI